VEEYKKSIEIEPDFGALNNLGDAQENMGDLAAAETSYRQAIAKDPASAVAHCNLASVLGKLGRTEEAIAEVEKALKIDPDYEKAKTRYRELTGK
jgi:tetratricopeptide (TPR) repeat protein